jgi:hypothetical protein
MPDSIGNVLKVIAGRQRPMGYSKERGAQHVDSRKVSGSNFDLFRFSRNTPSLAAESFFRAPMQAHQINLNGSVLRGIGGGPPAEVCTLKNLGALHAETNASVS